jgi:hypothetical protein
MFSTWLSDACWTADLYTTPEPDTIRFRRFDTDSGDFNFRYQIISDAGIAVTRGEFTHNGTSNNTAINTEPSRTIPIPNGTAHPLHTRNDKYDPGYQDSYANEMWIDESTGDTLYVASTTAGANMLLAWQVVQFTAEAGEPATRRVFVIT